VNSITLVIQAQKIMFGVAAGQSNAISIAPVADAAGAAPVSDSLAVGGAEYEITAPTGSKFDIADWWAKSAGGTPSLSIRFI